MKNNKRIGRDRNNHREYTKEELERWYKAVEECARGRYWTYEKIGE